MGGPDVRIDVMHLYYATWFYDKRQSDGVFAILQKKLRIAYVLYVFVPSFSSSTFLSYLDFEQLPAIKEIYSQIVFWEFLFIVLLIKHNGVYIIVLIEVDYK